MNKIKLSNIQFALLTSAAVYGSAPLVVPSDVAAVSKQDAWISAFLSILIGLLIVWINTTLAEQYPDKTIIEIVLLLFGKWFGGFVVINFVLIALIAASQILWYVGDFFTTTYLIQTPMYVINILFASVIAVALLYGLEAIARTTEVLFIFIFPTFILDMILLIPNAKIDNMFPIMENGIGTVLKGTIPILGLEIFPIILVNMIFAANAKNVAKAKKSIFIGYFLGISSLTISILMCILVLGSSLTSNLRFPLFDLAKEINVGIIFSRLEPIIILVWISTIFTTLYFYFYTGIIGISQLLRIKNYKNIVLPVCLITTVFSGFIYWNVPYEIEWDSYVWPLYVFPFGVILPFVLLVITLIKKYKLKKS